MNDEQLFNLALQFLQRCDIKGGEAPAMAAVANRLDELAKLAQSKRVRAEIEAEAKAAP